MKTIQDVRELVATAFGGLPMPRPDDIMRCGRADVGGYKQSIRLPEAFKRKRWQDLSHAMIAQWGVCVQIMSPVGYQYFLPALLTTALDLWGIEEAAGRVALEVLTPDAVCMYFEREDPEHETRIGTFSYEQELAVAAFLGLFLGEGPGIGAIRALRAFEWGWNHVESEERDEFAAFRTAMKDWDVPLPADPEAREIADRVCHAFADTVCPAYESMCTVDDASIATVALDLVGTDWRRLHPALIDVDREAISALSTPAFSYFVPSMMIYDLRLGLPDVPGLAVCASALYNLVFGVTRHLPRIDADVDDLAAAGVLSADQARTAHELADTLHLMRTTEEYRDTAHEKFSRFNRQQREAIIGFLQFRARVSPDMQDAVAEAIDTYWRPSIHTPSRRGGPSRRGPGRRR